MANSIKLISRPRTVAVVGRHAGLVKKVAEKTGFKVVSQKPEMVVTFGGDGTILHSERLYPGVPKLCARFSAHCIKCGVGTFFHKKLHKKEHVSLIHSQQALGEALEKIASKNKLRVREEKKLTGRVIRKNKIVFEATALNEIQVHNKNPLHAIRGRVCIGENGKYFIGDGVIVSTPFGSTAYFYSVARKTFSKGIGIAFNNPTLSIQPVIVEDLGSKSIRIFIERRHGLLISDNSTKTFSLEAGDEVEVKQAKQSAWFAVV